MRAKIATRERILEAALEVFARKGYHMAIVGRQGALSKVEAALTAALTTFAANERLARLILLEAVSLGSTYQVKRGEVAERS